MNVEARLKDNATGETRLYCYSLRDEKSHDDMASTTLYAWTEGNFSCDCNRKTFFLRAGNDEPDEYEAECGESRYELMQLTVDGEDLPLAAYRL